MKAVQECSVFKKVIAVLEKSVSKEGIAVAKTRGLGVFMVLIEECKPYLNSLITSYIGYIELKRVKNLDTEVNRLNNVRKCIDCGVGWETQDVKAFGRVANHAIYSLSKLKTNHTTDSIKKYLVYLERYFEYLYELYSTNKSTREMSQGRINQLARVNQKYRIKGMRISPNYSDITPKGYIINDPIESCNQEVALYIKNSVISPLSSSLWSEYDKSANYKLCGNKEGIFFIINLNTNKKVVSFRCGEDKVRYSTELERRLAVYGEEGIKALNSMKNLSNIGSIYFRPGLYGTGIVFTADSLEDPGCVDVYVM